MKDIIYLITSGEYSDYGVEGWFDNEEEAKIYCDVKNATDTYETYCVEELEKINITTKYNEDYKKIKTCYDVIFRNFNCSWKVDSIRENTYIGDKKEISLSGIIDNVIRNNGFYRVSVTTDNADKAEKIAQDYFYQKLAEKKGL